MAGTISLSMTQRFDKINGRLLSGAKLYFYAAGTTTPQLAYKDSGLTLPHPNPFTLDTDGMIPQLYFADGSIRCRLLDRAGVPQFDFDNILVNGPSSGGGGGGATDPNAIFQTGDVMWLDVTGTRAGWVRDNGRTIGSATSGGAERANVDCQNLFLYLWQTFSDTICPVVTGRGANALADWGANKQITLPDKRGYVVGGVTDMGNADSLRLASVPFTSGSATAAGSICGEARHTLAIAETPTHDHGGGNHNHLYNISAVGTPAVAGGSGAFFSAFQPALTGDSGAIIAAQGGGTGHNNTQLTVLGTYFRRL